MTTTGAVPPHRATILVGYGAFGLDVLRRLLASTAPRGVLKWQEPRGGAGPRERHLEDLALLWVPDPLLATPEQIQQQSARDEGAALEMMRDLYRQIRHVGTGETSADDLAHVLFQSAETLLSAAGRAGRGETLPLGLDVIVLARPTSREVIGALDRVLLPAIELLADNRNLRRGVQGAEALNFMAVLDFDNYWHRSERGGSIRRAVHSSVEYWQKRRHAGKPGLGRFYLVDGRTDDGIRDSFNRIDEISLFLEFLLFEGQRSGELWRLYQLSAQECAVSTFGIRLVERSAGLLAHLAAARFAIGWLDYLAGTGPLRSAAEPVDLRQRLAPFAPDVLDERLDADALHREAETEFLALEREVTSLPIEMPDWPQRVRTAYQRTLEKLEGSISVKAHGLMVEVARSHLSALPAELRAGIDADLHDTTDPVAVGTVITELENWMERLHDRPEVQPRSPDAAESLLKEIDDLHDRYERFHQERVDAERLRRWWPMLAIALAAGMTPIANDLLGDIPPPDATRFLLGQAYAALQRLNNPFVLSLLLFVGTWSVGALALQRSIAAKIDRARRFYVDADRGRFVDRLRSGLRAGGALRGPIDSLIGRLLSTMALSVRGEVMREVKRVLTRLRERRREMLWLRDQLRGFLRMHGVTGQDLRPDPGRLERTTTGIRYAMERAEDFDTMVRSNPPSADRFRSTQASEAPFAGWEERYSRSFLVPLEFLDRLSRTYQDPFQQELALPGKGPQQQRIERELLEFLAKRSRFGLAFRFEAQDGVPPDQRYFLLPPLWQRLESFRLGLSDLGFSERAMLTGTDDGRGYLLRVQTGVEPRCLLELE